jgi:acyl carrier protein
VPMRLDLAVLAGLPVEETPPLLRGLVRARARRAAPAADVGQLRHRLAGLPPAEREQALLELVREQVAVVLGFASGTAIAPNRPFKELGFDSLTAVELRNRLAAATGLRLPATLVFDYPTTGHVAGFVGAELGGGDSPDAAAQALVVEIDRLAASLAAVGDADVRFRLATRLRTVMGQLTGPAGPGGQLTAATDDDLFALIDGGGTD